MSLNECLFTPTVRYEERLPGSVYEGFVEAIVLKFASVLFPGYLALTCKPYFDTPHGGVFPDLVLLREDFSGWGLVEVEVEDHSANGHVKPQLGKLVNASPDQKALDKIAAAFKKHATLRDIEGAVERRPRVFLVTHGKSPVVQHHLDALGVDAVDVRIFSGGANDYKLLATDRSRKTRTLSSTLRRSGSPMMRAIWTLGEVNIPEFECQETVSVSVGGETTSWNIVRTGNGYILRMPTQIVDRVTFHRATVDVVTGVGQIFLTPIPERD